MFFGSFFCSSFISLIFSCYLSFLLLFTLFLFLVPLFHVLQSLFFPRSSLLFSPIPPFSSPSFYSSFLCSLFFGLYLFLVPLPLICPSSLPSLIYTLRSPLISTPFIRFPLIPLCSCLQLSTLCLCPLFLLFHAIYLILLFILVSLVVFSVLYLYPFLLSLSFSFLLNSLLNI